MSRFWCWERCSWAKIIMLVGLWTRRTAELRAVDGLASGALRAGVGNVEVGGVDLDLDGVVDDGVDGDARERGVAAGVGIIGRDAHEAVDAGLGLEPAIGVLALDLDDGALDAGFFALADVGDGDLVAAFLGPSRVHAQEHGSPVLAFGAAGTGVDLEVGVHAVGFTGEQGLDLAALDILDEALEGCLALGHGGFVVLRLTQLEQGHGIVEFALELLVAGDGAFHALTLAHDLLGALRIGPEVGILAVAVQLFEALFGRIPVKETSLARTATL